MSGNNFAAATSGNVPGPAAGQNKASFKGDGTWGSYPPVVQKFSASGIYTSTAGMTYAVIEMCGGGGGGGGSAGTASVNFSLGGSGGSGSYLKFMATAVDVGGVQPFSIGTGGAGGAAGNNNGAAGIPTNFGIIASCPGGNGGAGSTGSSLSAVKPGALGGAIPTISAGTLMIGIAGQSANSGWGMGGTLLGIIMSPPGGVTPGFGGQAGPGSFGIGTAAGSNSSNGSSASAPGCGGSGGVAEGFSSVAASGGAGADGIMIITEFFD